MSCCCEPTFSGKIPNDFHCLSHVFCLILLSPALAPRPASYCRLAVSIDHLL